MARTPRGRRSKSEVEQEFEKVRDEATQAKENANPKAAELLQQTEAEVRLAVGALSVQGVVQKLSGLNLEITRSLADVSGKLVSEVDRLAKLREASAIETRELERLHKIDIAATAVDQLVESYRAQKEQLESEITSQRAAWNEEEAVRTREQKEADETQKRQRQREADDFEYKKAMERKKAQDKYDEDARVLEKKNKEKQEALDKSWHERESALKTREDELLRLKKEADTFPARLKEATDQTVAQATSALDLGFQNKLALLKKDADSDARLAEQKVKALEENLARQALQLQSLTSQLDEAKKQVQNIAIKAIEGASGANALTHVNQIAIEQAKTRSGQS